MPFQRCWASLVRAGARLTSRKAFGETDQTFAENRLNPTEMKQLHKNAMSADSHEPIPEETSHSITSFLEQVQCCREEMQNMRVQIEVLRKFHDQIQKCTNELIRNDLSDKIEDKKTTITSSIIAIRNNVKSIQEIFSEKKISPALKRMKEVQISSLSKALSEITEEYYNCLVDHSEKCKKILYDIISIVDDDKADYEELIEKGKFAFFTNNLLLNELEQKLNFRDIEDRHLEIMRIERSTIELKNLMQDLSLIVGVQADHIDLVEQHVQKTTEKVDDAVKIIKAASKLRNRARRRKLIISLICISVLVIIVCVICWV